MKTLCADCLHLKIDTMDSDLTWTLFHKIGLGEIRITIYPKNCDNAHRPGHSQQGPKTLDELPPSARG